ncbi:hypothetical protein CXB34_17345 [Pseudomonas amygdali pv. morsprunorum]|nr:hypothetical protein CXB34_17345 [Pseudomonas amygdali pv. morsprunorum]
MRFFALLVCMRGPCRASGSAKVELMLPMASPRLLRVEPCLLLSFLVVLPQACHVCKPRLPMTQPMTRGK